MFLFNLDTGWIKVPVIFIAKVDSLCLYIFCLEYQTSAQEV